MELNKSISEKEYVQIKVSAKQFLSFYLEVPKGWRPNDNNKYLLDNLIRNNPDSLKFDDPICGQAFKVEEFHVVSLEEAKKSLAGSYSGGSSIKKV